LSKFEKADLQTAKGQASNAVNVQPLGIDIAADMARFGYALDCARYSGGRYRSLEPANARKMLKQAAYC
jgi:Mg-chelatase subunit ChlD